jgi:hypothetical protein
MEPIIFISRFRIREGAMTNVAAAFEGAVRAITETRPRTAGYAAYVDDGGSELRIVHAFPDGAAMLAHFEGSSERASAIADLLDYAGFEVLGPAPAPAIDQLRREARERGVTLGVWPRCIGGFLRPP